MPRARFTRLRSALRLALALALLVPIAAACGNSGAGSASQTAAHASEPGTTEGNRPSAEPATIAEVTALLAGIPQRENALGDPRAPVTLQYFGDLECPFCKRFTLGTLTALIRHYVRPGKLKVEYRSMRTATHNPETFTTQQVAALAAGKQNKLWNFIELFYHEQGEEDSGYVTEGYLQGLAQQVSGLNLLAWTAARSDARLTEELHSDAAAAREAGFNITPSFLLSHAQGTPYAATIKRLLQS